MGLENTFTIWQQLILYSPLGVIGAWRWGVWLWQKIFSLFYRPVPPDTNFIRPTLSIVTPVYNEDPDLFLSALLSWQHNGPDEIIAVIDSTDEPCIDMFRRFAEQVARESVSSPRFRLIVTDIPGKRPALAQGIMNADSEIVALVDSDTLWDTDIRDVLLAPFSDPHVGGVAPRQTVIATDTLARKLFAIRFDLTFFHEFPYLASIGNVITCLSGRTAVYRKSAILPLLDQLVHETFLGQHCISGDDKRLTSLIQKNGWHTRYQQNACVRTPGAARLTDLWKQGLRWARNSWRTDIRTFFSAWVWKREPFFAYHLLDRAISPFTLLLGPIYLGIALSFRYYLVAGILVAWWLMSRSIRLWPHLKRAPGDFRLVPIYICGQYATAILKIYAFFTLDYQSWITRWHASRIRILGFLELLPSRTATFCVVAGMTFFIANHEYSLAREQAIGKPDVPIVYTKDFAPFDLDQQEEDFWKKRSENAAGVYMTRLGDTPALLSRKYNLTSEQSDAFFGRSDPYALLQPDTKLIFPVEYLRNALTPVLPATANRPLLVTYDPLTDTITVKGRGQTVTLRTIADTPAVRFRRGLLSETAPKEWLLRSNLYISENVTLILDGNDVAWLKLLSTPKKFIRLRSYNGSILIHDTKITSWDEDQNAPDKNYGDGRASVIAQTSGRMDVIDSEIAYLGYSREVERAQRTGDKSLGGIYGLSWKIPNGSFGRSLLTGAVIGNRIHDNYFGIYTFGATGMVIRDNEVFDNIQYGIDPHDDSNNLLIENNFVHSNGNHGIIVSKRVTYSTIANNDSRDNRLHGIMLDRQSNYNLVENNLATNNINGMALYDSHRNLVRANTFTGNRFGIRANMNSSENIFRNNSIRRNERGVFLYGGAQGNIVRNNEIAANSEGVYLKEATGNFVLDSLKPAENAVAIKTDEQARTTNYIQTIR